MSKSGGQPRANVFPKESSYTFTESTYKNLIKTRYLYCNEISNSIWTKCLLAVPSACVHNYLKVFLKVEIHYCKKCVCKHQNIWPPIVPFMSSPYSIWEWWTLILAGFISSCCAKESLPLSQVSLMLMDSLCQPRRQTLFQFSEAF